MVLALVRELELAEAADAEIDVCQPAPARVIGAVQRLGVGARPIARAEGRGGRSRDHALQVAIMGIARRMSAGADPVREHVGVAIYDHARWGSRRQKAVEVYGNFRRRAWPGAVGRRMTADTLAADSLRKNA